MMEVKEFVALAHCSIHVEKACEQKLLGLKCSFVGEVLAFH